MLELRNLRQLRLPDGLEEIGAFWFKGSAIERVTIPASVREIRECAFKGCSKLRVVDFEEGSALEKIGFGAFYNSGLESFVCPSSLRSIADEAFCKCWRLKLAVLNEGLEVLGTNECQSGGK